MSQLTERVQNSSVRVVEDRDYSQSGDEASAKHTSTINLLITLLISPGQAFREIAKRPTVVIPLIIATGTVLAGNIFFQWYVKPNIEQIVRERVQQRDIANNRITSEADIEKQVALTKSITPFIMIGGGFATAAAYLLLSTIFYLGLRGIGLSPGFRLTLSVVLWSAALTNILASLSFLAVTLAIGREQLSDYDSAQSSTLLVTNLNAFIPSAYSASVKSLAASLDILTIWRLILLYIGFNIITAERGSNKQGVGLLLLTLWIAWVIIKALTAYLMNS